MTTMLVRQHRGGLAESMETVVEIEANMPALRKYIELIMAEMGVHPVPTILYKHVGVDVRNGWDTYLISIEGHGVFGMTNKEPVVI